MNEKMTIDDKVGDIITDAETLLMAQPNVTKNGILPYTGEDKIFCIPLIITTQQYRAKYLSVQRKTTETFNGENEFTSLSIRFGFGFFRRLVFRTDSSGTTYYNPGIWEAILASQAGQIKPEASAASECGHKDCKAIESRYGRHGIGK